MTATEPETIEVLEARQALELVEAQHRAARDADIRRRQAEAVEAARIERLCSKPGCELPGLPRTFNGAPTGIREVLYEVGLNDVVVKARLCENHYAAVVYALGKQVYDTDQAGVDRFTASLFGTVD